MLTTQHYIGFIVTLIITAAVGVYSLRFVKTASDFSVGGRKLSCWMVTGYLVGSFIGGTSTVGTAQVAYQYGISGLWFTLGAGLGCLLMGLLLVKPMREAEVDTIPQYLGENYGPWVVTWSSIYTTIGILIQVVAQVLAAIPLLMAMLPITLMQAALLSTGLILIYILFGGFWGTSLVGFFKTFLIYGSLGAAALYSLKLSGGISGLTEGLPGYPWFNFIPTGASKALAAIFSVVVGLISTQTYMQAAFAGKDVRSSKYGIYLAGVSIPLIGAASVVIGMFMRANYPDINAGLALPMFVINYLHPLFGGVVLASLLISFVMTGSALTLGACTMLSQDIYKKLFHPQVGDKELLIVSRVLILIVTGGVLAMVTSNLNSMILKWAFLSMALRGVTVFFPLLGAVFLKGQITQSGGAVAVVAAPLLAITWPLWKPVDVEPLYIGMCLSLISLLVGYMTTHSGQRVKFFRKY